MRQFATAKVVADMVGVFILFLTVGLIVAIGQAAAKKKALPPAQPPVPELPRTIPELKAARAQLVIQKRALALRMRSVRDEARALNVDVEKPDVLGALFFEALDTSAPAGSGETWHPADEGAGAVPASG